MKMKFERVRLEMIDEPVNPDRDLIDPDKIRELAESIRSEGLKQAIKIRPVNGRFEIVWGRRRYLAHRFLGLDAIDAYIQEMTDVEVFKERAIENLQRENLTPVEEGKTYYRLHFECALSLREVCAATGKALSTVQKYLKIMELDDEFKRAIDRKEIAIETAFVLWRVQDERMRSYYLKMAVDNGVTVAVAELWVSDYEKSKAGTFFDGVGGDTCTVDIPESRPSYMTCGSCFAPVEVKLCRSVVVCPSCLTRIKSGGLGKV